MCSISGIFSANPEYSNEILRHQAICMSRQMKHRGPDDMGEFVDIDNNIFFSHNRLKIIDLTKNGSQPMMSNSGRYHLIFNGEIYNHKFLKDELYQINKNITWRGTSDTEVLLHYIENTNLPDTLKKIKGMFAISLWDNKEKKLTIARDRFGEKPLYYYFKNKSVYFASEVKAIVALDFFENELNLNSLNSYCNFGFINSDQSIYKNINKVDPGYYIVFTKENLVNKKIVKTPYWNAENFVNNLKINNSYKNIVDKVESILDKVVTNQLISDVKVGTFLSGGIDSSLVTYLAQKNSKKKINTFSISFDDPKYNEGDYAKTVSSLIGTNHTNFKMTLKNFENFIISDNYFYDEPFFDISQFPTLLLSQLSKKETNVVLTGDGGDEIFGGYNRYQLSRKIIPIILKIPFKLRKNLILFIKKITKNGNYIDMFVNFFLINILKLAQVENKKQRIFQILESENEIEIYFNLLKCDDVSTFSKILNFDYINKSYDITENFMINDIKDYLPNNILYKVDTASMNYSLETRAPLLDHELFEFVSTIPIKYKFHKNKSKSILKSILEKKIPEKIINRPKMGFDFPLVEWTMNSKILQKELQKLFLTKIENLENYLCRDLCYTVLKKNFTINSKNIFYIWKVANLKKWFLKKF